MGSEMCIRDSGDTVEALAVQDGEETILWIANRTGEDRELSVPEGVSILRDVGRGELCGRKSGRARTPIAAQAIHRSTYQPAPLCRRHTCRPSAKVGIARSMITAEE